MLSGGTSWNITAVCVAVAVGGVVGVDVAPPGCVAVGLGMTWVPVAVGLGVPGWEVLVGVAVGRTGVFVAVGSTGVLVAVGWMVVGVAVTAPGTVIL